MLQSFIKDWLLQKKKKVYSIIAVTYREELTKLKPTLFRLWLAKELGVPEEAINIHSLYSAVKRFRKKEGTQDKNKSSNHRQNTVSSEDNKDSSQKNGQFNFSPASSEDKSTKRLTEY
ncbi:MAG TPA: hypothetical protein VGB84_00100 [Arachidicoccus sp.]